MGAGAEHVTPIGAFRALRASLDPRARTRIGLSAVLAAVERCALVGVALAVRHDAAVLAIGGIYAAAVVARGMHRVAFRSDVRARLYQRSVEKLLAADVTTQDPLGSDDPQAVLMDGVYQGTLLIADRAPELIGDALAAVVVGVVLAVSLPMALIVVASVGFMTAGVGVALGRGATARAHEAAWEAYRPALDNMLLAIRGRLEIVAAGKERLLERDLLRSLGAWRRMDVRADGIGWLTGRVPLAAAAVLGAGFMWRFSTSIAAKDAVLLGASLPVFVGLVWNAHAALRVAVTLNPMMQLLSLPARQAGGSKTAGTCERIDVKDVSYMYFPTEHPVLKGFSLTMERGHAVLLTGRNGSGKSTLLRLLLGLAKPARGQILVDGNDLFSLDLATHRARTAYLAQSPYFPARATVRSAMRMLAGSDAREEDMRASLGRVDLLAALEARSDDPLSIPISALSAGERQRVALARVLVLNADIVLLDEPDANLDSNGVRVVAEAIRELAKTRVVVVAAHSKEIIGAGDVVVPLAA